MAKLTNLPALAVISGFKGTLDYYVHDGVPCVRKWPRSPGHKRSPAVMAQWEAFAYGTRLWSLMSPYVRSKYHMLGKPPKRSARDWHVKAYLSGLDYDHVPLP